MYYVVWMKLDRTEHLHSDRNQICGCLDGGIKTNSKEQTVFSGVMEKDLFLFCSNDCFLFHSTIFFVKSLAAQEEGQRMFRGSQGWQISVTFQMVI